MLLCSACGGKQLTLNAEQKKGIDAHAIRVCAFSISSDMLVPCSGMLDKVAYNNEARGLKSLKRQAFIRCIEGTIVDGTIKDPNRTGCNACF